ncbi:right-handed parallel beta-helix repeat-containing protein [Luteimonas sp. 8-5]|uniref:right-handed parallel beta-helix repeat-containing protein n=1 Tax=Luteimonas sp. 8-5 TaxID=3039387 RepID=UPI002436E189|nr:right-handed parallel beta-helix repeat-containing protein [Luteimonas sp. 8-5]MDG6347722.1 right-handed parallel beta-helix repeat-containing protein [Luteimonas sp. 8-5]
MLRTFAPVVLWALALAAPAQAAEPAPDCTGYIERAPAKIDQPGTWCLANDISYMGNLGSAILVEADDATVDCTQHKIIGNGGGHVTSHGVHLSARRGVTVKNCYITGFQYGVIAIGDGGRGNVIEDNRVVGNHFVGIYAAGDHSIVQRNEVSDTGGATFSPLALGIMTKGSVDIIDNTVAGVVGGGEGNGSAFGIDTSLNDGGVISGNRVREIVPGGSGSAYGIYNASPGWVVVRENDVAGPHAGPGIGLRCADSKGLVQGNAVGGFATPSVGCRDAGDNSYLAPSP